MGAESLLKGLTVQEANGLDKEITEEVTNHLFRDEGADFGSDLMARNLQRGRDHGLPGYSSFRRLCGLAAVSGLAARDRWSLLPSMSCAQAV